MGSSSRRNSEGAGLDGEAFGAVVGLVDAHQMVRQLKHVIAQAATKHKLHSFGQAR